MYIYICIHTYINTYVHPVFVFWKYRFPMSFPKTPRTNIPQKQFCVPSSFEGIRPFKGVRRVALAGGGVPPKQLEVQGHLAFHVGGGSLWAVCEKFLSSRGRNSSS